MDGTSWLDTSGDVFTGVVAFHGAFPYVDLVVAKVVNSGQPLLLPADTFMESSVVTIYMYRLTRHEGTLRASPGDASVCIPRSELVVEHFQCRREICAGLGGIALGSRRTGIRPLAHLDCNGLACSTLRNNGAEHVIEGNVCDDGCIAQLHMASCPHRSLLAVGFPCQPFSLQGDRKGEWDPRTSAFWGSLRACWHLQASAMIMECVASVLRHPFIVQALHQLAVSGENDHAAIARSVACQA